MHKEFLQQTINNIEVESLDDTIAKTEQSGGKKLNGPNEIPGIGTHAYCTDIGGNILGVIQFVTAS